MKTVQELIDFLNALPNKNVPLTWEVDYYGLHDNWETTEVDPEIKWTPKGITINLTVSD